MRWVSLGSNHFTIPPEGTEGLNRMSNADHPEAVVVGRDRAPRKRRGAFSLVPGFFYILILYIIGKYVFADPRATLFDFLGYKLSWVESSWSPPPSWLWPSRSRWPTPASTIPPKSC